MAIVKDENSVQILSNIITSNFVTYGIIFLENIGLKDIFQININQEIIFVDTKSWKVYEHFTINGVKTEQQLGFFNKTFHYVPIIHKSFLNRRSNFQGYTLKAVTENSAQFIQIDLQSDNVQFDPKRFFSIK